MQLYDVDLQEKSAFVVYEDEPDGVVEVPPPKSCCCAWFC
jgi:hypothetical protein